MNRIAASCIISILFSGCDNPPEKSTLAQQTSAADPVVIDSILLDTIESTYRVYNNELDLNIAGKDTLLIIDRQKYLLSWTSQLDTLDSLHYTEVYKFGDKAHKYNCSGYQAHYNITLRDKANKTIFSRSFSKEEFRPFFDQGILTRSSADLPVFLGYLEQFDAFVYSIDFWTPGSDVGGQVLLMINRKGEITGNSLSNYFGGGDCDGDITVSPKGDFVLSCKKIINANGQIVEIGNEDIWLIGAKLINDHCILVIQEYSDSNNINATLVDNFGKTISRFSYRGYYNALGNTIPMHFDSLTNNYYLLDVDSSYLRVINKFSPQRTHTMNFIKMPGAQHSKKKNEITFELNTEATENTFYIDTLAKKVRHSSPENMN